MPTQPAQGPYGLPRGVPRNSFAQMVQATAGLVGFWRLNERSGTTAYDSGPNGLNGTFGAGVTINQAPIFPGDQGSRAMRFNGGNVVIGSNGLLNLGDQVSIMALVQGTAGGILSKDQDAYYLRIDGTPPVAATMLRAKVAGLATSSLKVPATGALVACTKSGASTRIYINGQDVTSPIGNSTLANNGNSLRIGSHDGGGEWFIGLLQDVSLWSIALTPDQMRSFYRALTGR